MTLTPAFLDELRARTLLSALIGRSMKLAKAGREYKGCCPFHNEKTPSFYVNDDKGFYHCFGCSAHGDAIRFLTENKGLPFMDAVKELAAAAGMEVPAADPRAAKQAERQTGLAAANEAAAKWFAEELKGIGGAEARAYLKKRGINDALAAAFGMGFAPDARRKLKSALASFGNETLIEVGLLISVEEKDPYDRFRGRLMIPIRDPRGRTIAFGGRILNSGEPKYLNSPDTPLFDKGRTLFNVDRAGPASRKANRLIVVEGYMDVIALAKAGIDEVVAPNGTAVTEAQLERMWRLAEVPILCLDGDTAGRKAAVRAAVRALPLVGPGRGLAFATLPAGQDPDDLINAGGRDAFEAVVSNPVRMVDLLYRAERDQADTTTPEGRAGLRQSIINLANSVQNGLVQSEYRRSFNDRFFEDYGWKRGERRVIGESVIRSGPHGPINLFQSYLRSALYGLARFPAVLALTIEPVSYLKIDSQVLLPWRETMIEAIIKRPDLDDDALRAILDASRLKPRTAIDLQVDLRFPWDVDADRAIRTLGGLIEFLHDEQALLGELSDLEKRLAADPNAQDFAKLDSEWAELRARKASLYEFGYQLGSGGNESGSG